MKYIYRGRNRTRQGFVAIAILCSVWSSPAVAQTTFEEPDSAIDMSQYTTPEHCQALLARLGWREQRKETINRDTMPDGWGLASSPWTRYISDAVKNCSGRWPEREVPLEDWRQYAVLYLVAGRVVDATNLFNRRLNAVAGVRDSVWAAVLDSIAVFYATARPVYLQEFDSVVQILVKLPVNAYPTKRKIGGLWRTRKLAVTEGDSGLAMRVAVQADSLFKGLTDVERRDPWFTDPFVRAQEEAKENNRFIHWQERLDSLKKGVKQYVQVVKTQEDAVMGVSGNDDSGNKIRIGAVSPVIRGDIWFPKTPEVPRPSAGKISIVIPSDGCFVPEYGTAYWERQCVGLGARLRRMLTRYPDIEITLLTFQKGRAILSSRASLNEESENEKIWLTEGGKLSHKKLPDGVALAIEKADFVQVAEPDGRMVNTLWTLDVMASFGAVYGNGRLHAGGNLVVAPNGVIVGRGLGDSELFELLDVLVDATN